MAEVKTAYRQFLGGFLGCPLMMIQVWTQIKPAQISAVPDLVTDYDFAFLMQWDVDLTWLMVWCLEISKVDLAMQTKSIVLSSAELQIILSLCTVSTRGCSLLGIKSCLLLSKRNMHVLHQFYSGVDFFCFLGGIFFLFQNKFWAKLTFTFDTI